MKFVILVYGVESVPKTTAFRRSPIFRGHMVFEC